MEVLICLSIFIVLSSIWAMNKSKNRTRRSQRGSYYNDYDHGYDDDSD